MVCIGMNPNKQYPVSPQTRAELTRRMLQGTAAAKNVQVQGTIKGNHWSIDSKQM